MTTSSDKRYTTDGWLKPNEVSMFAPCKVCGGEEWVTYVLPPEERVGEGDNGERVRPCSCRDHRMMQRRFRTSQITEEMKQFGFKNFITDGRPDVVRDAKATALEYFKSFQDIKGERNNSIFLCGNPGSGKTHLLTAVARNLMSKGTPVLYFPWVEGFNEIRASFDNKEEMSVREKVYFMQTVPVLFIDDLLKGREKPTNFEQSQLFAIVNYRYLNHLPMLISSEWTTGEITALDEAIGSRIHEMCRGRIVVLRGEDDLNYRMLEG